VPLAGIKMLLGVAKVTLCQAKMSLGGIKVLLGGIEMLLTYVKVTLCQIKVLLACIKMLLADEEVLPAVIKVPLEGVDKKNRDMLQACPLKL
jgi:hypothetical protein